MTIFSKIWLGFLVLASLVFAYFAGYLWKTNQIWRVTYHQLEKELDAKTKLKHEKDRGVVKISDDMMVVESPGVRQGKQILTFRRPGGATYRDRVPKQIDQTGKVYVDMFQPNHGLKDGDLLYVFDEATQQEGGQYIGDFKVAAIQPNTATIEIVPAQNYGPPQAGEQKKLYDRINRTIGVHGKWALYQNLVIDAPDLFKDAPAGLTDQLPEAVRELYQKDGQPAPADEPLTVIDPNNPDQEYPALRVVNENGTKVYRRSLRNFQDLIMDLDRKLFELTSDVAEKQTDLEKWKSVEAQGQDDVKDADAEIAQVKTVKGEVDHEEDALKAEEAQLKQALEALRSQVQTVYQEVKQQAAEIERIHAEALRRASGRTAGLAPVPALPAAMFQPGSSLQRLTLPTQN